MNTFETSSDSWQKKLANGSLFNLSWLAIVVTASTYIAPAVVVVHLLIHHFFIGFKKNEPFLILGVTATGVLLDVLLFRVGLFHVDGEIAAPPVWLGCLWPVLATTFMHAFHTLQKHLFFAAPIGAVGGALSYIAGTRLSEVEFASAGTAPFVIGALWFMLFPLLLVFARSLSSPQQVQHA